jgi:flavodoxin
MKSLVVYYSLDGNAKFIGDLIAQSVGADTIELKPKKKLPSNKYLKMIIGGFQAKFRKKPELLPYDKNPEAYDVIFIGTPVWAGTYAPALNTFFYNERFVNKKIAFYCTYGGSDGKAVDDIKEALSENIFLGEIGFISPLTRSKDKCTEKARDWAKRMLDKTVKK